MTVNMVKGNAHGQSGMACAISDDESEQESDEHINVRRM